VPGQDGGWADEPVRHQVAGEESDQGSEGRAVSPVQLWPGTGPTQDCVLVTEDQNLDILGRMLRASSASHSVVRRNAR
jgi:hypothetical protein